MKYLKTHESFLNKEIDFNYKQIEELYKLGLTRHDYYDTVAFHYTPIVTYNITDIRISRIELVKSADPTWFSNISSQYRIETTFSTGKKIIKEFPEIPTSHKIFKKIGLIKIDSNNDDDFEQALEYIKEQIPKIDRNINKYNL